MTNMNLSPDEVKLIQASRERSQVEGNLTETERALVEAARNRKFTMEDLDRWDSLTPAERAAAREQINRAAIAAQSGQ